MYRTPFSASAVACSWSSVYRELPPSMMMSPASRCAPSSPIVCLVGSPDGTITHTTRGADRAPASASSESTVRGLSGLRS